MTLTIADINPALTNLRRAEVSLDSAAATFIRCIAIEREDDIGLRARRLLQVSAFHLVIQHLIEAAKAGNHDALTAAQLVQSMRDSLT